jgi:hypothetical protein
VDVGRVVLGTDLACRQCGSEGQAKVASLERGATLATFIALSVFLFKILLLSDDTHRSSASP